MSSMVTTGRKKINVGPISGFPERLPQERIAEQRLIDKIRKTFELFGYAPLETSAVERLEVLNAKNDGGLKQQIYRLYSPLIEKDETGKRVLKGWEPTENALHFDLTVPLARFVADNSSSLTFPFRRYQIQKVWRGESAQKKRFREFYQCDIDIIGDGKLNLSADAEIPFVISRIFTELQIGGFKIGISNRQIMEGVLEFFGVENETLMFKALEIIDALPKEGPAAVRENLRRVLPQDLTERVLSIGGIRGSAEDVFKKLDAENIDNPRFSRGLAELREVAGYLVMFGMPANSYELDMSVIRGLDYYTGTVYETMLDEFPGLSICSGGRYDDLASHFIDRQFPGVGISIGLTRLFVDLLEAKSQDISAQTPSKVLVAVQDRSLLESAFRLTTHLREEGFPAEVYLEEKDLRAQLGYADQKKIPLVVIFNKIEDAEDVCHLKNMRTKAQHLITMDSLKTKVAAELDTISKMRKHRVEAD